MRTFLFLLCLGASLSTSAQFIPEIHSWYLNTTGATGYNNQDADCQQVQYSNDFVYVSCSGIPEYTIGPWPGNPNTAQDQDYTFKIPRNPVEETGAKTATPLGAQAVFVNGVPAYNALDAFSYNNQDIWHQDAYVFEGQSFDGTGGHPQQMGGYHYHIGPEMLYPSNPNQHSPLIGYSFDGFPIYGPYGYSDANDTNSAIRRIETGYSLRNIANRQTLPDGTNLQPSQYGPAIGGQYPLGSFVEDYEWLGSNGDLDAFNGRVCKTPEYPNGIYAYFVTIDSVGDPVYPYIIGPEYYGDVEMANIGPGGGHVNVTEPTTDWDGSVPQTTGINGIWMWNLLCSQIRRIHTST